MSSLRLRSKTQCPRSRLSSTGASRSPSELLDTVPATSNGLRSSSSEIRVKRPYKRSVATRVLREELMRLTVTSIAARSASSIVSSKRSIKSATTTAAMAAYRPSSRRVSRLCQYTGLFLEHHPAHVPYRQEHAEGEDEDQHAEGDGDQRLDIGGEVLDLIVDFALVHVSDFVEQVVQLASFLADGDHL